MCSLGLGFGSIISIASHIQSSSSCLNDAVIVALANLISMMLVTPFIFSVLGFWATQLTHRCNENTTLLHDLRLAESMDTELDTEELQMWRSDYKLKVDFQPCRGMALPTSHF